MSTTHKFIVYVADRAATREANALADYFGIGQLIVSKELTYEVARDQLADAFAERSMSAATAKTYVSQGYSLAQLFDTLADLETFADEDCNGSRSLKAIYSATRVKESADESAAAESVPTPLVDVVLAGLANLKSAADIKRVLDAAQAMLTAKAA